MQAGNFWLDTQDRKIVRAMTVYGIEQHQTCAVLAITDKTLRRHFRIRRNGNGTPGPIRDPQDRPRRGAA
jgi:hypothetical protein